MKSILLLVCTFLVMNSYGQDFVIYQGDTINQIIDGNKERHWIYFGSMKPTPGFKDTDKIQEGDYIASRKVNEWVSYYANGNIKAKHTFVNNRAIGDYSEFYKTGEIMEEGTWVNGKNHGSMKRYFKSGQVMQDFFFDKTGRRSGEQTYYFENGQKELAGTWDNGRENGKITRWYNDGNVKSVQNFTDGKSDPFTIEEPTAELVADEIPPSVPQADPPGELKDTDLDVNHKGLDYIKDGRQTVYRKDKQILMIGEIKHHKLVNGEYYRYNVDGINIAIQLYKNGKYVGDVPLNEPDNQLKILEGQ